MFLFFPPPRFTGLLLLFALGLAFSWLLPSGAHANGGALRAADVIIGGYRVAIFTDPTPVQVDSLDVSVLVVVDDSREVADGLSVRIRADPVGHDGAVAVRSATREAADDPRYYAAKFPLGSPGSWRIEVEVSGPLGSGSTAFEITAREWGLLSHPLFIVLVALLPLGLAGWWLLRTAPAEGSVATPGPPET